MSVGLYLVCPDGLVREALSVSLSAAKLEVLAAVAVVDDLDDVTEDDLLIVIPSGDLVAQVRQVSDFADERPGLRVLAVVPEINTIPVGADHRIDFFISRDADPALLASAVALIEHGYRLVRQSRSGPQQTSDIPVQYRLSPKERRVLVTLKDGLSNKAIANLLDISEATVKAHLKSIYRKIGAENRTQAAVIADTLAQTQTSPLAISVSGKP